MFAPMTDAAAPESAQSRPLTQDGPALRLFLVDGSAYLFRAYHALPPLTRKSDGLPVGAVQGFCNMLWKLMRDMQGDAPTHLAVIWDHSEKTFRNKLYDQYKAHRPPPPEDLIPQFPLVRDATRAFGVPAIELPGYEADDLIAAYACAARDAGGEAVIVSSDKDLMQLVGDSVSMFDPMKSVRIGRAEVFEKFGVYPEQVVDVQSLCGDSVDNVPGAPGIGIKTAAQLITEYGDLDTLLARAGEIKQPKRRETLINFADQIRLSKALVTLDCDTPLPEPLDDLVVREPDKAVLAAFLEEMEFRTLARRVGDGNAAAAPRTMDARPDARPSGKAVTAPVTSVSYVSAAARAAANPVAEPVAIDHAAYVCVRDLATLQVWIDKARAKGVVAFDTETDALSSANAGLCGVSLAIAPGEACYIPVSHEEKPQDGGLAFEAPAKLEQISEEEALAALKPLLEDPAVLKVAQNAKYDIAVMARRGIAVAPIEDTMLISYVLEAGLHGHGMDELSELWLGHKPIAFKDVAGTGKSQISFKHVALDKATAYAAEDADVTLRLYNVLRPRLAAEGLLTVYETLERPLPAVLATMENDGVRVDPDTLRRLSNEFSLRMAEFEEQAQKLAGRPFNLGSPKQIGDVLFGELNMKGGKKTATGQWSTDSDVLESLANEHELPRVLLDWRQLSKLKGTYTENLIAAISERTGRVHTSYALAATTTGRLSSSDPNLQNIPVRTEEGRKIRKAFVAEPGKVLISADYSQIELRLLAHIGQIPQLQQAFRDGLDIHAMTASEMFDTPIEGMDPLIRRRAKAINFGIVYGISAFGLANQLGIGQGEAGAYIKTYFERFPGIQAYMDATRAFVREHGYVSTIFGRKINIPDIHAKSVGQRQFSERAAINAPIQGAAADVMRRAMVRMPAALEEAGLKARMLLQVHDELVFEAPQEEADAVCALARRVMEGAAEPAVALSVPLTVEARAAPNWDEAH
jgi:DNA polymerase I